MKFNLKNNSDYGNYSIVSGNNKDAYNWYITADENIKTANEILLPTNIFNSDKIKEKGTSLILLIKSIINIVTTGIQ